MQKMLPKMMSIVMALAVCSASGAHWMLLQSVAWVGMVATFAQDRPLSQAVSDALDGQHPCEMCKVISDGQRQEKQLPASTSRGLAGKVLLYFVAEEGIPLPAWRRAELVRIAIDGECRRRRRRRPPRQG